MPIAHAIRTVMQVRQLKMPDLLGRIGRRDRSTIYRLLSGDTQDTKVSTFLDLCSALSIAPNDLLGLAGLWSEAGRAGEPLDLRLRRAFATVQALPAPYQIVAVTQIERLIGTWEEVADGTMERDGQAP
jgi:DNA-binding Xre family transcriptional regulator